MSRYCSISLQGSRSVHCTRPSNAFGHKVQVIRVVKSWRGDGPRIHRDQVAWVLHTVTRAQAIREASVYSGALSRQGAGPLRDPRPEILNLLVNVL